MTLKEIEIMLKKTSQIILTLSVLCSPGWSIDELRIPVPEALADINSADFQNAINWGNWTDRPGLGKCVQEQFHKWNVSETQLKNQSGPNVESMLRSKRDIIKNAIEACWREHPIDRTKSKDDVKKIEEDLMNEAHHEPDAWSWCNPRTWSCFQGKKKVQ